MHFDKRVSNDLHEADYITCITSKDLDPPAHAPVLSNAAATAAVHGALKMTNANSNSNSPQSQLQKSSPSTSPLLSATASPAGLAKNVNNNDSPAEDGVVMPGGGKLGFDFCVRSFLMPPQANPMLIYESYRFFSQVIT